MRANMVTVSVIVPVRNEADNIGMLLDDLMQQTRRPEEVLVIDTGSTDETVSIVDAKAAADKRIRLLAAPSALPGGGRNVGLEAAAGDWVAFVDAGMRIAGDWLSCLMEPVDSGQSVDVVLGGLEPVAATRAERAAALAFVPARRPTPAGGLWRGYCLPSSAVRTSLARSVGGFPAALRSGEDLVFFERIRPRARISYAPAAIVHWRHASSPAQVWRRFRTYAEHSFRGGLMADWFDVIRRRYSALAVVSGPALPVTAALFLLARAAVVQHRKPEFVDTSLAGRFCQLFEVAFYLGIIDAATWAAWWSWRRSGRIVVDAATAAASRTEGASW